MSHASTAVVSSVDTEDKNEQKENDNLLASACVNSAIVLGVFAIWSTYSPMTVPNWNVTVTHVRHLAQHGSTKVPVPLPASNLTRLGLDDGGSFLVLFPRDWQTAS